MPKIPDAAAAAPQMNPLASAPTPATQLMAASMLGESAARRSPSARGPELQTGEARRKARTKVVR